MARYGAWQNDNLIRAASQLSHAQRTAEAGLFFGSVFNTLNHLLWADQLWHARLADRQAPAVTQIPDSCALHDSWSAYVEDRRQTDREIERWAEEVTSQGLEDQLVWESQSQGKTMRVTRWITVVQTFNHGTHHRGQVHAVLTRHGISTADTDVPFLPGLAELAL